MKWLDFLFLQQNSNMYIIGITGGTASGKTTFVEQLIAQCDADWVNIISQDDYYKPLSHLTLEEREKTNFDHPDALDFELLEQHLLSLKKGETIEKPTYSFETHNRLVQKIDILPKPILILEGILVLSILEIKSLCDYTIFVDAPEIVRQERRLQRDMAERGRTRESVLYQFETNIHPMHRQFIDPIKTTVNKIIDGTQSFDTPLKEVVNLIEKQVSLP